MNGSTNAQIKSEVMARSLTDIDIGAGEGSCFGFQAHSHQSPNMMVIVVLNQTGKERMLARDNQKLR